MINEFIKPKHTSIKFEDIETKKAYAFNFNPQRSGSTPLQLAFNKDASVLRQVKTDFNVISQCLKTTQICVCTECSPLGRIHYHGKVMIYNKLDWITELKLLMQLGTVCVKPINEVADWDKYCTKQSSFWIEFFKDTNLKYPYFVPIPVRLEDKGNFYENGQED